MVKISEKRRFFNVQADSSGDMPNGSSPIDSASELKKSAFSADVPTGSRWRTILAERGNIHAEFERTARFGFVPAEALIVCLFTNHRDELAEDNRQLDTLEQTLEAHLRRLDTLFPAPVPPQPEPPLPPRPRKYGCLSDTWSQPHAYTRH